MRLVSYTIDDKPAFGVVREGGVVTLSDRPRGNYPTLKEALADEGVIDEMMNLAEGAEPDQEIEELKYLPVIPNPGKILCVGINYRSHAAEHGHAVAEKPNIFTKFTDTLVAHNGTMLRPKASTQLDFEGELVVVMGRGGRAIPAKASLELRAGDLLEIRTPGGGGWGAR